MASIADIENSSNKKRAGRPKVDSVGVMVKLRPELKVILDDWRRKQADMPNRPEAIRRLIERGAVG